MPPHASAAMHRWQAAIEGLAAAQENRRTGTRASTDHVLTVVVRSLFVPVRIVAVMESSMVSKGRKSGWPPGPCEVGPPRQCPHLQAVFLSQLEISLYNSWGAANSDLTNHAAINDQ